MDESLLQELVDKGRELGASYVESRYHENRGFLVNVRNGKPIGISYIKESGVGIRVLVNGSLGFAATSDTTRESLLN
ncbi:MAG: DNA gyrase modulator, partial [Desulfurococcaceae archaeon]